MDIQVLIVMLLFLLVVKLTGTHNFGLIVVSKVILGNIHHLRALIPLLETH